MTKLVTSQAEDPWFISVDDHVIEPPHVWQERLPAKFREFGPTWVDVEGGQAWRYEDELQPLSGSVTNGALADWRQRPPVWMPVRFEEIEPACYDPQERVKAMDADREIGALLFPNLPGFAGSTFMRGKDKELALACLRVYNDWLLEDWCATVPGRFIPVALVPLWDPALAALEVERAKAMGAKAISFSMAPQNLGLPSIHVPGHWDPFFAAVNDTGLPLCTHLGTGQGIEKMREMAMNSMPPALLMATTMLDGQQTLLEWLYSGLFDRFPNLRLCLSENGIDWIPPVLHIVEWLRMVQVERTPDPAGFEIPAGFPAGDQLMGLRFMEEKLTTFYASSPEPAEQFRNHVFGCFLPDDQGLRSLHDVGVDNVMIESDFPHTASVYPRTLEIALELLAPYTAEERYKVLRGNAERVFDFEPAEPPAAVDLAIA